MLPWWIATRSTQLQWQYSGWLLP